MQNNQKIDLSQTIRRVQQEIRDSAQELKTKESELTEREQVVAQLNQEMLKLHEDEIMGTRRSNPANDIVVLQKEIKELTMQLHTKTEELKRKTEDLKEFSDKKENKQKRIADIKNQLKQEEIVIPKLRGDINRIKIEQIKRHHELLELEKAVQEALRNQNKR